MKFNDSNEYEYFETTGNFNLNAFKEQYPNLDIKLNLSDTNENIKITTDNMDDFKHFEPLFEIINDIIKDSKEKTNFLVLHIRSLATIKV